MLYKGTHCVSLNYRAEGADSFLRHQQPFVCLIKATRPNFFLITMVQYNHPIKKKMHWTQSLGIHLAICCIFTIAYFAVNSRRDNESTETRPSLEDAFYYSVNMHFTVGLGQPHSNLYVRRITILHTLVAFAALLYTGSSIV